MSKGEHKFKVILLYKVWSNMKDRCYNQNHPAFHRYGSRGISICDEWKNSRSAFIKWAMNNGYRKGLEIDRIDNNGNYTPENCRFVTRKINLLNRECVKLISYCGQTKRIDEWLEILDMDYHTLYYRLRRGWTVEDALGRPVRKVNFKKFSKTQAA